MRSGPGCRRSRCPPPRLWLVREGLLAHQTSGHPLPVSEPDSERCRWFIEEVHAHDSSVRAYLRGAFPRMRDVDDLMQESYRRVWATRSAEPIRSARAFLFRVAKHLALDWIRREKASPFERDDAAGHAVAAEDVGIGEAVCAREEAELLAAAIDALPARCREIVIRRKLRGLSQKEIAAELGLSEQTVQVQIARGVKKCAMHLRGRGVWR